MINIIQSCKITLFKHKNITKVVIGCKNVSNFNLWSGCIFVYQFNQLVNVRNGTFNLSFYPEIVLIDFYWFSYHFWHIIILLIHTYTKSICQLDMLDTLMLPFRLLVDISFICSLKISKDIRLTLRQEQKFVHVIRYFRKIVLFAMLNTIIQRLNHAFHMLSV